MSAMVVTGMSLSECSLQSKEKKMNGPNAPVTAVEHIVQAFNGYGQPSLEEPWLVSFPNGEHSESALKLINMLKGWTAESHPGIQNVIQISDV